MGDFQICISVPLTICSANQLTGFYMMGTLAIKGLRVLIYIRDYIKAAKMF